MRSMGHIGDTSQEITEGRDSARKTGCAVKPRSSRPYTPHAPGVRPAPWDVRYCVRRPQSVPRSIMSFGRCKGMLWSFVFFLGITYVLGLASLWLVTGYRRLDPATHVMSTGIGLAAFAVLAVLLNTCHVPLRWWAFLATGCVLLGLGEVRNRLWGQPSGSKLAGVAVSNTGFGHLGIATALAIICFAVFLHGAFLAPWLSDDDSWVHASSAKYVALNHTYSISPQAREGRVACIEPYPPAYAVLMGSFTSSTTRSPTRSGSSTCLWSRLGLSTFG